jgi:hypothetical protein
MSFSTTFEEMGAFVYITACSLVGFLLVLFFVLVLRMKAGALKELGEVFGIPLRKHLRYGR